MVRVENKRWGNSTSALGFTTAFVGPSEFLSNLTCAMSMTRGARATNSVQWRPLEVKTSSSAVAKRPRDASCLSVVSFVASIVQYLERSCVIISYFGFKFTSTYNSILFCCLRRNVEPCCHTHDSRYSIVEFNVPIDTLYVISETILRVRWPNQQCHSTEGRRLVNHVKGQSTRLSSL